MTKNSGDISLNHDMSGDHQCFSSHQNNMLNPSMVIDFYKQFFQNIKEWKIPWQKNQESALSALCLSDSCLTQDWICLIVLLSFEICEMNWMQHSLQSSKIQHWITTMFLNYIALCHVPLKMKTEVLIVSL